MPTRESIFASPIIKVYVGETAKLFHVHLDILAQSPVLFSRIRKGSDGPSIIDLGVSGLAFDLTLQFLYGRPYNTLRDTLWAMIEPCSNDTALLELAYELLCVASKYKLVGLENALISYFLDSQDLSYQYVLVAAKHVYTKAQSVESWFKDFIYRRTQEALVADPGLVDQTWFMETFEHGHGGLSRHLFECYKDWCRLSHGGIRTPSTEKDRSVDLEGKASPERLDSPTEPLKELPVAWDQGLTLKEKKKKGKMMKLDGTWDDRVTQDMVDVADVKAEIREITPSPEVDLELFHVPDPESMVEELQTPNKVPWDDGFTAKERKNRERMMKLDGTWCDRITQETIDEENTAREAIAATTMVSQEPVHSPEPAPAPSPPSVSQPEPELVVEPEAELVTVPEPSSELVECIEPWDFGLNVKEKRRKQRQMMLDGTWETRLTQEMIDEEIVAATAAATTHVEVEPEPFMEAVSVSELHMGSGPVVEEFHGWGFNERSVPNSKTKKKSEPFPVFESEFEPQPEHELAPAEPKAADEVWDPWGFSPAKRQKNKKKSFLMTEPIFEPETVATPVLESMPAPEVEPLLEPVSDPAPVATQRSCDRGFCFRGSPQYKADTQKNFVNDPEPVPQQEHTIDDNWASWTVSLAKKKKDKKKERAFVEPVFQSQVEPAPASEPEPEPLLEPEPLIEQADDWSMEWGSLESKPKEKQQSGSDPNPVSEIAPQQKRTADDILETLAFGSSKTKKDKKKKCSFIEPLYEPAPEPEPIIEEPEQISSAPGPYGQIHRCTARTQHLLEKSQWQACFRCMNEVESMARRAA